MLCQEVRNLMCHAVVRSYLTIHTGIDRLHPNVLNIHKEAVLHSTDVSFDLHDIQHNMDLVKRTDLPLLRLGVRQILRPGTRADDFDPFCLFAI